MAAAPCLHVHPTCIILTGLYKKARYKIVHGMDASEKAIAALNDGIISLITVDGFITKMSSQELMDLNASRRYRFD